MKHYIILYLSTIAIMAILDGLWIGVIAREFYKNKIGSILEFSLTPAIVFYLMYTAGILIFVSASSIAVSWQSVALYGALLGLVAYGTYDLTNMATIRNWPLSLVLVDVAWGIFNTAICATGGWLIANYFKN